MLKKYGQYILSFLFILLVSTGNSVSSPRIFSCESVSDDSVLISFDGKNLTLPNGRDIKRTTSSIYLKFNSQRYAGDEIYHIRVATRRVPKNGISAAPVFKDVRVGRNAPKGRCAPKTKPFRTLRSFFTGGNIYVNREEYYEVLVKKNNSRARGTNNSSLYGGRATWHFDYDAIDGSGNNCVSTADTIERIPAQNGPNNPGIEPTPGSNEQDESLLLSGFFERWINVQPNTAFAYGDSANTIAAVRNDTRYISLLVGVDPEERKPVCYKTNIKDLFDWAMDMARRDELKTTIQIKKLGEGSGQRTVNYDAILLNWVE